MNQPSFIASDGRLHSHHPHIGGTPASHASQISARFLDEAAASGGHEAFHSRHCHWPHLVRLVRARRSIHVTEGDIEFLALSTRMTEEISQ